MKTTARGMAAVLALAGCLASARAQEPAADPLRLDLDEAVETALHQAFGLRVARHDVAAAGGVVVRPVPGRLRAEDEEQ